MIFDFLRKKADKTQSRFVWIDKELTITTDEDFDIDESLTLSDEDKQEFKEQGENKQP